MKVTMELTLDGLVRALRQAAHGLAEDAEAGYVRREVEPGAFVVRASTGSGAHHGGYGDVEVFRSVRRPRAMFDGPTARDEEFGE